MENYQRLSSNQMREKYVEKIKKAIGYVFLKFISVF